MKEFQPIAEKFRDTLLGFQRALFPMDCSVVCREPCSPQIAVWSAESNVSCRLQCGSQTAPFSVACRPLRSLPEQTCAPGNSTHFLAEPLIQRLRVGRNLKSYVVLSSTHLTSVSIKGPNVVNIKALVCSRWKRPVSTVCSEIYRENPQIKTQPDGQVQVAHPQCVTYVPDRMDGPRLCGHNSNQHSSACICVTCCFFSIITISTKCPHYSCARQSHYS